MNVDIIEPFNRLHLAGGVKISALKLSNDRLFVGFSNGDLTVMKTSTQVVPSRSAPKSVRSFRSFSDITRLFSDNDQSQLLLIEKTFKKVTCNLTPITSLDTLPLYRDTSREVLILGNSEILQVFEWVGSHLNLMKSFEEARNYSKFNWLETPDSKLILIGAKKRLQVFKVVQKSRNIFDFNLAKEFPLKERIRAITCYPEDGIALLGLPHSFLILEAETLELRELPTDESSVYSHTQGTSFSYFGFSSGGPQVKILRCGKFSLVVRDTQVGVLRLNDQNCPFNESKIELTSVPIDAAFLHPCYVLFLYPKKLEIIDIESGELIQVFQHLLNSNSVFLSVENEVIMISSDSYVFQFNILPYQKQLDQFLSIRGAGSSPKGGKDPSNDLRLIGLNRALGLVTSLEESDEFFKDRSDTHMTNRKMKQIFLRDLYKEKVLIYFELYAKYHEALIDMASEWVLSCKDILPLFPDFLNGDFQLGTDKTPTKAHTLIKRVKIEDVRKFLSDGLADSATESEAKTERKPGARESEKMPWLQQMKKFSKAVGYLIVYLTDQRRIHLSFLNSSQQVPTISWKGVELSVLDIYPGISGESLKPSLEHFAAVIDTSLFLCYFYTKPMLLGPLLRLPNNKCDAQIVNDCLLRDLHQHTPELQNYIRELLDFYFGRRLHSDALEMLKNLAHEINLQHESLGKFLHGPDLTISYLQKLDNQYLDLVCKYATWVLTEDDSQATKHAQLIFMNELYECESYDNFKVVEFLKNVVSTDVLAIRYLEWLVLESDVLESADRTAHVGKFSTQLCLLYLDALKQLHASDKEIRTNANYIKLHNLLQNTAHYDPWTVLRDIPTSQDTFLRLTIFIYKRLGEHQKSVDILFNQLSDLDQAMAYSAEVYNQPHMKKEGTRLLHKLLEDLVMHYDENQDLVAKLLKLEGAKMSTLEVLTILPNSFPLHKLQTYIEEQVRNGEDELYTTRVASQLYKIGSAKILHKVLVAESGYCSVNSGNQRCHICGEKFGYSVLCVGNDKRIVHYGCVNNAKRQ